MVKHTQTIRRQIVYELFECACDHFVGLALKGLNESFVSRSQHSYIKELEH